MSGGRRSMLELANLGLELLDIPVCMSSSAGKEQGSVIEETVDALDANFGVGVAALLVVLAAR